MLQRIDRARSKVIGRLLNNQAVQKAEAGEYLEASRMLTEAALLTEQSPGGIERPLSILMDVFMNGYDVAKTSTSKTVPRGRQRAK